MRKPSSSSIAFRTIGCLLVDVLRFVSLVSFAKNDSASSWVTWTNFQECDIRNTTASLMHGGIFF